jgi:hypothetical protein
MAKSQKYSVPVTRKTLDVFIVEARNGSEAAFIAAEAIAEGKQPDQQTNLGRTIGTARPLVDDDDGPEAA